MLLGWHNIEVFHLSPRTVTKFTLVGQHDGLHPSFAVFTVPTAHIFAKYSSVVVGKKPARLASGLCH